MPGARLALLLLLVVAPAARAEEGDASRTIRLADTRARELLARVTRAGGDEGRQLEDALAHETHALFDGPELARSVLAGRWDGLATATRDEIAELLETLVVRRHLASLRAYGRSPVEYQSETTEGDTTLVKTVLRIERRGRPAALQVDYLLRRAGTGWRIHDVRTDGVSLVETYRSQFNRMIAHHGVDGFVAILRRKAAATP